MDICATKSKVAHTGKHSVRQAVFRSCQLDTMLAKTDQRIWIVQVDRGWQASVMNGESRLDQ